MKLKDLVSLMKPTFLLVIAAKDAAPTDAYLFDGTVADLTPDWLDRLVVALNHSPYSGGVEAVVV